MVEPDVLEQARRETGLSMSDLWLRYFAVGGMSTALEVEAVLYGALVAEPENRDLIALALNERFCELGRGYPLRYSHDEPVDPVEQ